MKKILFVLVLGLICIGCKREGCMDPAATNYDPNATQEDGSCEFPLQFTGTWPVNNNIYRNVLIENYAGHLCTNCPAANSVANNLEMNNPNRVFLATIHASPDGTFQEVQLPDFNIDFTTTAGDTYADVMTGFLGNPLGTVNRNLGGFLNTHWYFSSDWTTAVNNYISNASLLANLQLQYDYSAQNNELIIYTETEFQSNLSGDFKLILYLLRDEVISPQQLSNGTTDYLYTHKSVLSGNINGTWGTTLINGTVSNGDFYYENFIYQLPDPSFDGTFDINNLSIIAYICNRNTYEVIQVIKTELAP